MAELLLPGAPTRVYLGENTVLASMLAKQAEAYSLDAAGHAVDAALSSATAESAAGPTYASTAAGLAATVDGQSFAVGNGDGTVTVWLNDGGTAVEQRTLATTAALASPNGATRVGYKAGTVAQRLSGEWSVSDNLTASQFADVQAGVLGDDLTAKIQEMLSDSAIRSLTFPGGYYKVSAGASDSECLLVERNMNLLAPAGQQKTRIIGFMPGNTDGAVMRVRMIGSGDVRNWTMRGIGMYPEPSVGGAHGLVIADDGLPMLTCTLDDLTLGRNPNNGGRAAILGYVWAHSTMRCCTISGGILSECGDANLFYKNLSLGDGEPAYTFDLVPGVRNNTIRDSTIVNRGGVLHIIDGQEIRLLNNQCEHFAGAPSTNTVEAMVWIEGRTRAVTDTIIEDNNFGGGTNYKRSIYVDNARNTIITKNHFIAPGIDSIGGNADVYLTANARDTIIEPNNTATSTQLSSRLDRLHPLRVIDSGVGTKGSLRTDLSLQNGWKCAGYWKDATGQVRFRSSFSGGATTEGTTMGVLPLGYRPAPLMDTTRRNLLNSTADFSTTGWVRSAITVTPEQGSAPNGRNEYALIAATAATAAHQFRNAGTNLTTTNRVQVSFYVKRTSGSTTETIRGLFDGPTGNATFTVNLTTGAVVITPVGGATAVASSSAVSDGWGVVIDYTPAAPGVHYLRLTPKNTASVYDSYLGAPATDNFLLWGPQVEVADVATSYQAIYSETMFSTQFFNITIPVQTSDGPGTVTISNLGVIKAGALPAANAMIPAFQSALIS